MCWLYVLCVVAFVLPVWAVGVLLAGGASFIVAKASKTGQSGKVKLSRKRKNKLASDAALVKMQPYHAQISTHALDDGGSRIGDPILTPLGMHSIRSLLQIDLLPSSMFCLFYPACCFSSTVWPCVKRWFYVLESILICASDVCFGVHGLCVGFKKWIASSAHCSLKYPGLFLIIYSIGV